MSKEKAAASSFEDVRAILRDFSLQLKKSHEAADLQRKKDREEMRELRESQKAYDLQRKKDLEKFNFELKKSQKAADLQWKRDQEKFEREMRERDERFEREMRERDEEERKRRREMDRMFKKTDQHIQKIGGQFNTKWGEVAESLVEGNLTEVLRGQGMDVNQIFPGLQRKSDGVNIDKEYDFLAANGTEAVLVEVKATLTVKKVKDFLRDGLPEFKKYFPAYKNHTLYGAMGYMKASDEARNFAEESGLFVIRAPAGIGVCVNKPHFKPKAFS